MTLPKMNLLIITILLSSFISCSSTENHNFQKKHKYEKTIDSLMVNSHNLGLFNGSVIISINDSIIFNNSYGYTDASKVKKLNDSSIFSIGSIAKEFYAVSIMMLAENESLNLNDSLTKFDLELPEWSDKIKIKHLLSYSSGIPKINYENDHNDTDVYNSLKSLNQLVFEPGNDYNYNNNSLFIQKKIIEKASNQKFENFVLDNIIRPLNLRHFVFDSKETNLNFVQAFNNDNVNDEKYKGPTTGWLNLSNNDLHKYLIALHSQKLISEKSLHLLFKNNFNNRETSLGNSKFDKDVLISHYHQGSTYNFESLIYNNSKLGLSVTLTTNNKNFKLYQIADAIENITQEKEFEIPKKSIYLTIRETCYKDVNEGIEHYHKLKREFPNQYNFLDSGELNNIGYKLIQKAQIKDAIRIFELLIEEFPNESNSYDSYGESLLLNQQYDLALKSYRKSLELDSNNKNAEKKIQEILNR